MSQLDFEHLDHAYDDGGGLSQPAPGKATLTSRLARPALPASGGIDAGSHASLEGGLGIELSRPARSYGGGDDGDGATARGGGSRRGLSFLGGGVDVGPDTGRAPAAAPAGRGLEYLGDVESTGFTVAAKLDGAPAERPGEDAVHALATASVGGGEALPTSLRGSLESATGAGLGGVRVHTDEHAQTASSSINARAFARGQDIHFAPGQYDPASAGGQHLIAHEVAHTIQQSSAPRAKADGPSVSSPTDSFEVEADRFADAFVGGSTAPISTGASQTTAFRAPDPAPVAPPPGKEGARGPDGRREFPKNAGPPPASMAYSVKPPTAPVKPGEPGPNVKQPPGGPPLPAQPLTAKGAPKGDAKDGADKKADGKDATGKAKGEGKGKGDDAAAAKAPKAPPGPPPSAPPQHAVVPSILPVQPVVMGDPGNITEHEIKQWTTKTGRGPADHRAEIEAVLSQLQSEVTTKQAEIAALGKQLRAELELANTQRVGAFDAKIKTGSGTVSAAFDKITTGLTPLATKAKATVEQSRAEGEGKIKAAEATKGAELKAAFTAANTAVATLSTKEAPAYEAIFGDFAKGLNDAGTFARGAADLESKSIVDKHKPEDCAGKGVPQARMTLEASLRQETAKATTKDAKKKIDGIVNPAALDVQKNAAGQVQALIKPYKDALDIEVKKADGSSKTNFAGAVKTAQDGLAEGAKEANTTIDKAVGTAQSTIAADKATTMAMVDGAGKKASGEVKHAGQEMASRIDERAAKDANEIGALLQEAKGIVAGKRLNADKTKPKLQDILDDVSALATAADAGLRELLTKGKLDLEDVIVKQEAAFTTAITEGTEQATAADTKIQKEITKGAEDFAAGHGKLVQGFDDTINKDIAKVTTVTATFNATASAGLKVQSDQVRNRMMMVVLPDARKQLTEIAKSIPRSRRQDRRRSDRGQEQGRRRQGRQAALGHGRLGHRREPDLRPAPRRRLRRDRADRGDLRRALRSPRRQGHVAPALRPVGRDERQRARRSPRRTSTTSATSPSSSSCRTAAAGTTTRRASRRSCAAPPTRSSRPSPPRRRPPSIWCATTWAGATSTPSMRCSTPTWTATAVCARPTPSGCSTPWRAAAPTRPRSRRCSRPAPTRSSARCCARSSTSTPRTSRAGAPRPSATRTARSRPIPRPAR